MPPHPQQSNCSHLATATNIPITSIFHLKDLQKPVCVDCGCPGPNLWICLYKNCLQVVCGEKSNDHSTLHNAEHPSHCIHMNLLTKRIWCYECVGEVFIDAPAPPSSDEEMEARDSGHGSYTARGAPSVGMGGDVSDASEDEPPDTSGRPLGLVGLQNIGNTCYMNAALQALSNAVPLTKFFLECGATVQVLSEGKKPGLSRTYQTLIRDMWKKNGGYVTPSGILYGIRSVHPMFRGFYQHDTQEFLRNFMDQLHEELKQVALVEAGPGDADTFSLAMDEPAGMSSSYDSSEGEYETCDSGVSERSSLSDDTERPSPKRRLSRSGLRSRLQNVVESQTPGTPPQSKKQQRYRSIISDVFDGKLLSSVQCLTCDRVSSRVETFQDLSLPIPSRDHLVVLHGRVVGATCSEAVLPVVPDGWISWILAWLKSWLYGPVVTLHDCLAAFFSTDELKGDNMYSCEKCNKLRNGIKFSKVLQLPEVLCIHLKRFRHELMFSSKISAAVSFPLQGLDMRPYLHTDCISKVSTYELFSVICHYGTAGGGHYISYALNNHQWYEFDDQYVTRVPPEKVQCCEAYVLFYRKNTSTADEVRAKALRMSKSASSHPQVAYISKQWICRFNNCAEPGAIDNSDFLCQHGAVNPDRELVFNQVVVALPLTVYEYLHKKFGGCAPLVNVTICAVCLAFNKRLLFEMERFMQLTQEAQAQDAPSTHLISTAWYAQWHKFVHKRVAEPPGPIDNSKVGVFDAKEKAEVSQPIWDFFFSIYGGGPELRLPGEKEGGEEEQQFSGGEPMDVEEIECEDVRDSKGDAGVLSNGVEDGSEEEVCVEVKSKRHRRRRKIMSN